MEIPDSVRSLRYLAKITVYTVGEINQLELSQILELLDQELGFFEAALGFGLQSQRSPLGKLGVDQVIKFDFALLDRFKMNGLSFHH